MLGSATKSFSDIVMSGEMIENAVKSGKINVGENFKRTAPMKKENEFISQRTEKCDPIFRLFKKHNPGVWDEDCQKTFDKVKHYLSNAPVFMPPNLDRPLILYLVVFKNSMRCVLGQHDESGRKERAIYYLSKKFTECETRYSPIEKLCCALIWRTRRLRQYMMYHTTWLISKLDPLKYMMESTALNGRMARWQILLSEFDIVYVNQKAVKGNIIADFLASRALEDYESLNFDFSNEDLMYVATNEEDFQEGHHRKLNFDGVSNAVGNKIGAILISPNGDHYPFTSKLDFDCTNNMAEYEACIMGIRAAIECKIKVLEVYGDSALVIYQLKGEFIEVKANKQEEVKPIQKSIYETQAHCYNIEEEKEEDGHPWYHDILRYVKNHVVEAKQILEEVHEGVCRTHANGFTMAGKIMRFSQFKIKHHNSSLYRPKRNDAVEAANKNIKKIMGKMNETYKYCHEKLPFALYAYRTSVRTSTGTTPFSLVYGLELVLPIEVEIPSL
ncbi:RNA-directed DNA polymerase (Reverse transcriptase), Ribonuclease H [Gossypium australe]|uniref:RNA-directed DNA polymerase (Reverse transcriptase), Ribonuclease H n=1 Tax=Gossypium australe TaxID=47621 RepID=A0A5B6WMF3_9ROSI|nr:RNA-directed DNA polymerase (Reverse transcriptase), Ribonuclease H [Gossypium australe]